MKRSLPALLVLAAGGRMRRQHHRPLESHTLARAAAANAATGLDVHGQEPAVKRKQSQSEQFHAPPNLWAHQGGIASEFIGELEHHRSKDGLAVRRATRARGDHGFRDDFVSKLETEGETLLTFLVTGLMVLVGLATVVLLGIWVVISAM